MSGPTDQYIRHALHETPRPPPAKARFFYTSPIPIDDPLSPVPPSSTRSSWSKQPPKAFSKYDNAALDAAWLELRPRLLKYDKEQGEKSRTAEESRSKSASRSTQDDGRGSGAAPATPRSKARLPASSLNQVEVPSIEGYVSSEDPAIIEPGSAPDTTGNPFIRAPSRKQLPAIPRDEKPVRPAIKTHDTYERDDASHLVNHTPTEAERPGSKEQDKQAPSTQVPVGVSRLHQVEMPDLKMTPIYWTPVGDVAEVIRATWFYQDTMLPVETDVANMNLQVWTETWKDELNSAIEVGAAGEEKIVHRLWPETKGSKTISSTPSSRRGTVSRADREDLLRTATSNLAFEGDAETPEQIRDRAVEAACNIIDVSTGPKMDNKAAGVSIHGQQGSVRTYASFGVIYANAKEARLLKPSLLPSNYFGRRPLANYIRKGHALGIKVVRGFDQAVWDRLHPPKDGTTAKKAEQGAAMSGTGIPPNVRRKTDPSLARAERPKVTELVLVIHGIGQQYSKRVESYNFTHAMNAFRRDVHVEVGSKEVKARFRKDMGNVMVLPINWRHTLSFEEGGYEDAVDNPAVNAFTMADITPDTLPSVRNIVNDIFQDVPRYMSHHRPQMIAAVIQEANRVYQLWCLNNPGFSENGRVHLIAHSLFSVMAMDILSNQPTTIPQHLSDPTTVDLNAQQMKHFLFNTSSFFMAGSPAGFFLLLQKSQLLPRIDHPSATALDDPILNEAAVCGKQGEYGCLAVDNVYNIINPYDPVAYRMNAAVDSAYAASLKQATIPSATLGWFGVGTKSNTVLSGSSTGRAGSKLPNLPRLPSNVEMETHNFTREEVAEKRMFLLNDNGQIDYFLRYGGGTFEIQYITMLGAHSSYWVLKDFTRMIVTEVGREKGRDGTFLGMRATKKKTSRV